MTKEPRWLTDEEVDNPDFKEWRSKSSQEWFKIYDYTTAEEQGLPLVVFDPWIWNQFCSWEEGKSPEQFAKEYKEQYIK